MASSLETRGKVVQVQAQVRVDLGGVEGGNYTAKVEAGQVARLDRGTGGASPSRERPL